MMTTIGVIYAISHSAGEVCSNLIKEKAISNNLANIRVVYHEQKSDIYKQATSDTHKIALLLKESLDHLVNIEGAEIIVIAANSVHRAYTELKNMIQSETYADKINLLNIMDETTAVCAKRNRKKVCILGSSSTIKSRLYQNKLEKVGIEAFELYQEQQMIINQLIEKQVTLNNITLDEQKKIKSLVLELKFAGVDSLVLGCTDLGAVFNEKNIDMEIIDSNICLANATVSAIEKKQLTNANLTQNTTDTANYSAFRKLY